MHCGSDSSCSCRWRSWRSGKRSKHRHPICSFCSSTMTTVSVKVGDRRGHRSQRRWRGTRNVRPKAPCIWKQNYSLSPGRSLSRDIVSLDTPSHSCTFTLSLSCTLTHALSQTHSEVSRPRSSNIRPDWASASSPLTTLRELRCATRIRSCGLGWTRASSLRAPRDRECSPSARSTLTAQPPAASRWE